jgi:hypothetical protein
LRYSRNNLLFAHQAH